MILRRWWTEFIQPELKCRRLGHKPYTFERKGYRDATTTAIFVAFRVVQSVTRCGRCLTDLRVREISSIGLSGLTLPEHWSRVLDEKGEVWTA